MRDPVLSYPVVTEQGFPHGLMCPECKRVIEVGQPFTSVLNHAPGEDGGYWVTRVQCVYC